jgi:exodeoxyribonuclease VII large subunit
MKTPTAVAAFLIECVDGQFDELADLQQTVCAKASEALSDAQTALNRLVTNFPAMIGYIIERKRSQLFSFSRDVSGVRLYVEKNHSALTEIGQKMRTRIISLITNQMQELSLHEQFLKMASPDYILKKGYTLVIKEGKTVKHASSLVAGDDITLRFTDGEKEAKIC